MNEQLGLCKINWTCQCNYFSIALDESSDAADVSQLFVFLRKSLTVNLLQAKSVWTNSGHRPVEFQHKSC